MLRTLFILCCTLLLQTTISAQHYRTAVGLRLGSEKTIGLSVQQKIIDNFTVEGILQLSGGNTGQNSIIVLAEQHQKILFKRLNLYYGLGLHKSWYQNAVEPNTTNPAGLAAIAGLELAVARMAVSLDIQPNLNIWGGNEFLYTTTGVSLRYVLWKPKKKKKKWKFWKKENRKR